MKTQFKNAIVTALLGITALFIGQPATALASIPTTPAGLCIQTSAGGTVCASDPTAAPTPALSNVNAPLSVNPNNFHPGYYMLVGTAEGISSFNLIVNNPEMVGVRKVYDWRNLEPQQGVYDFSQIAADLGYLQSIGKRLFIGVRLDGGWTSPRTPSYMWNNPSYGCGPNYYGTFVRPDGAIMGCYWNQNFINRAVALLNALGKRFDNEPYFEGMTRGETSTGACQNCGYSPSGVEDGFKALALAAKKAFPDKVIIQHINYASFDLIGFADWLAANGIGIGGPDIHLSDTTNSLVTDIYPLYQKYHDTVPTGPEVQWDNYVVNTIAPGDSSIAQTILKGAISYTNPWYLFWVNRSPYMTNDVLPTTSTYGQLPAAKSFYNTLLQ